MRVAVTGAFSYSGKYITRHLLERGDTVITLTGHPQRPDPFGGQVPVYPLDFQDERGLVQSLAATQVLVNTYWIRFDRGGNTQSRAVENTRALIRAASTAGVQRVVHISITNPSLSSALPYFRGKAANEETVRRSGLPYAILRPTVLFGTEDILINNIAFLLRRFPVFLLPGDGTYHLQPIFVDDLAALAVEGIDAHESYIVDAVGPEDFTFKEMVELIGTAVGSPRPLIPVPRQLVQMAAQFLGTFLGDVLLTAQEIQGLMSNLLVSAEPPRGKTPLSDWLQQNRTSLGIRYASELGRHYAA